MVSAPYVSRKDYADAITYSRIFALALTNSLVTLSLVLLSEAAR